MFAGAEAVLRTRQFRKLEEISEWHSVRQTLMEKLSLDELQMRQIEAEIESKPFDSLDFVELVMSLEERFGISIRL
jgi:acyl carrier protein